MRVDYELVSPSGGYREPGECSLTFFLNDNPSTKEKSCRWPFEGDDSLHFEIDACDPHRDIFNQRVQGYLRIGTFPGPIDGILGRNSIVAKGRLEPSE